ncbi:MAG: hypothetical protein HXY19_01680 [Thermoanaerobaculaceae bacterium]|nr:hypothetical protein [Thermoanaerobaculaceae bacterium]
MSGPVWRFERELRGVCDVCLKECEGLFVEGQVADNELTASTRLCPDCYRNAGWTVVSGERGRRAPAPAYVHR